MARGDGVHRTNVRNSKISDANIIKAQMHNEREKEVYSNQDIVADRTQMNVHFKTPTDNYMSMFEKMVADKSVSVRGLKADAIKFGELIFDVNSSYFETHGGYDFAKKFYADAYKSAVKIVGGEEYIISAVMHADERNRALSDELGKDVYHYHMHVIYVPVVPKEILWTKRCKNADLVGTVKERIMQVSMSKKWASKPVIGDDGKPMQTATGKTVFKPSYAVLQDEFFTHMKSAGYMDLERGEFASTEEHLTITQFKVMKEQERLKELQNAHTEINKKSLNLQCIEKIEAKPTLWGNKFTVDRDDFDMLITAAKKYIAQEKKENMLQKALDAANKLIDELKKMIAELTEKLTAAYKDLLRCKSEKEELNKENDNLRRKIHTYDDVISQNNLSAFFYSENEKCRENDDER